MVTPPYSEWLRNSSGAVGMTDPSRFIDTRESRPPASSAKAPPSAASRATSTGRRSRPSAVGSRAIHLQLLDHPAGRARACAQARVATRRRSTCSQGHRPAASGATRLQHHVITGPGRFLLHRRRRAAPALQSQRDRAGDRGHRPHRSQRAGERGAAAGAGNGRRLGEPRLTASFRGRRSRTRLPAPRKDAAITSSPSRATAFSPRRSSARRRPAFPIPHQPW